MIFSVWFDRLHTFGLTNGKIIILILLPLIATISEIVGIGIFLPILQFIRLDGDLNALVLDSNVWQYIVDAFSFLNIEPTLIILLLISFFLFMSRQALTYLRLVYSIAITQSLIQTQRNSLFDSYINANTEYHDNSPVGDLVNVIITEVNNGVSAVMGPLELIVYILMFVGYMAILLLLSWQMTLFSVSVFILVSIAPKKWINKSKHIGRKLVDANILMSDFLIGRLRSPRLVRLSGTEVAEKKEFRRLTLAQRKHSVFNSILQTKTETIMEPFVIGLSLVFLYFSYSVFKLQVEVIGLYLVIVMRLMPVLKSIVLKIHSMQSMLGSIEALENRYKSMENSVEKNNGTLNIMEIKHSISIDNACYKYPSSKNYALKNISIEFNKNQMTAIVGPSGGGKSTLIDLLPSLRIPTSGKICIDGVDIKIFSLQSIRDLIAYVPQSPQIFNGTVKNHILYGKKDATDKEVMDAIQLAGAEEFIEKLPQGIGTILGDDAIKISGGQRQRLDLARALVRKAKILILDEPTSNLDASSENKFMSTLNNIKKETNTTIIIVAHRLASISNANKIVVLNEGKVDGEGKHIELLDKNSWYAQAWNLQNN